MSIGSTSTARSGRFPVGAEHLAIDPCAVGSGEKGDDGGDVRGLAQPFERRELGEVVDHRLRLAFEEELGGLQSSPIVAAPAEMQ
jgi:hypothetical protein